MAPGGRGFRTKYRYTGKWLDWDLTSEERRRKKICFAAVEILSIAVYLAASLQCTSFNSQRFSSGLFVLALIPWIAEIWGVIRLITIRKPMMIPDFDEIKNCITIGSSVRMVLIACALAVGLGTLLSGGEISAMSIAAAFGHLISGATSFIIFKGYTTLPYDYHDTPVTVPGDL